MTMCVYLGVFFFFFKQKTAYEMRISDWSSDVCSSDLPARGRWRDLFTRQHMRSMAFLSGMYLFWNLWAGTNGFFFPYILRTVGNQTQAMSVAVQALSFLLGVATIFFIFMKLYDRVIQRLLLALYPLTTGAQPTSVA